MPNLAWLGREMGTAATQSKKWSKLWYFGRQFSTPTPSSGDKVKFGTEAWTVCLLLSAV